MNNEKASDIDKLNKTQTKIFKCILCNPMTKKEISAKTGISTKTISNNVPMMTGVLEHHKIHRHSSHSGTLFSITPSDQEEMSASDRVRQFLLAHPKSNNRDVVAETGCSERTIQRVKDNLYDTVWAGQAPKILIFDIETAPMEVFIWRLGKQYVGPHNVIKDWSLLTWSAKWLFDSEVMSAGVSPKEAKDRTDKSIIKKMWSLLDEADIIIAHNAIGFDVPNLNARFKLNGLPPPMPYQVIDTLKISRRMFGFSSHKLDYINQILGKRRKIETNFDLWVRCVNGDQEALDEMEKYNRGDVTALEELYVEFRPWIKSHPNMNLYCESNKKACPNCGSENLKYRGYYYTPAGKFKAFRCECGARGRERKSENIDRESITLSVAR